MDEQDTIYINDKILVIEALVLARPAAKSKISGDISIRPTPIANALFLLLELSSSMIVVTYVSK